MNSKKILLLTGPQGSGNHLWSKIFSLHPEVFGWKTLLENYWEAHRFAEPFCKCWRDPNLLKEFDWSTHQYFFTSISIPLGIQDTKWEPDIMGFVNAVEELGIETQIVVVGRDQNILRHQQNRLRGESTLHHFMSQLPKFPNPIFLSYELLYLYKQDYLKSLDVGIPIDWNNSKINDILEEDPNDKYIHSVNNYVLDNCNRTGIPLKDLPK
jgi:hypothetical protein